MSTFDKIVTWVMITLCVAMGIGCIGAYVWDWKWHNLLLAVLVFLIAGGYVNDYIVNNKKQQ